jgi:hypothetical protein
MYFMEFIPRKNQSAVGASFFIIESMIGAVGAIYFIWFTNAYTYISVGYGMQILGAILAFLIPESPKHLMSLDRHSQAADVLNSLVAKNRVNSQQIEEVKFNAWDLSNSKDQT